MSSKEVLRLIVRDVIKFEKQVDLIALYRRMKFNELKNRKQEQKLYD